MNSIRLREIFKSQDESTFSVEFLDESGTVIDATPFEYYRDALQLVVETMVRDKWPDVKVGNEHVCGDSEYREFMKKVDDGT